MAILSARSRFQCLHETVKGRLPIRLLCQIVHAPHARGQAERNAVPRGLPPPGSGRFPRPVVVRHEQQLRPALGSATELESVSRRNRHRPTAPLAVGFKSTYWMTNSSTVTLVLILSENVVPSLVSHNPLNPA